jgi:hypothetical protein
MRNVAFFLVVAVLLSRPAFANSSLTQSAVSRPIDSVVGVSKISEAEEGNQIKGIFEMTVQMHRTPGCDSRSVGTALFEQDIRYDSENGASLLHVMELQDGGKPHACTSLTKVLTLRYSFAKDHPSDWIVVVPYYKESVVYDPSTGGYVLEGPPWQAKVIRVHRENGVSQITLDDERNPEVLDQVRRVQRELL